MNDYFIYKDEKYFVGTTVRMNKEIFQKKYGVGLQCFEFKFVQHNQFSNSYYFEPIDQYTYVIDIGENDLNQYIDDIVVRCVTQTDNSEFSVNEFEVPGMAISWAWFVIFLIVLLLFKNGIACATVFIVAFLNYRKNKMQNYKNTHRRRK